MRRLFLLIVVVALAAGMVFANTPPSAIELLAIGRVEDAVKVLRARTAAEPKDAEAWHLLGRSFYAMGRWDDAINATRQAVTLKPDSSDYHLWLGRAYGQKAEASSWHWWTAISFAGKARTEFEKAVELDATNVGAQSDLAEFYAEAPGIVGGGKDKARRQADVLAKHDAAAAHWIRGLLAEKDKDIKTAEQEYRAAITESGGDGGRWLDLAAFFRRSGRITEMQEAIGHAIAAEKKPSVVFFDAASILFESGQDLSRAAEFLRRYLSSNNQVEEAPAFQAHYLLGTILEKQGQPDAAAGEYRAALDLNSDFSGAQNALKRLGQH